MMELDFSKMKWRIDTVPLDKEITTFFPDIAKMFHGFTEPLNAVDAPTDLILRYVIYAYHQHSPFIKVEDAYLRKKMAMVHAGAKLDVNELPGVLQNIVNNEVEEVVMCVIQLMKFERTTKYMSLMVQREAWWKLHKDLLMGKPVLPQINALNESINTIESEMFNNENELGNFVSAHTEISKRIISPEQYVNSLKSKV